MFPNLDFVKNHRILIIYVTNICQLKDSVDEFLVSVQRENPKDETWGITFFLISSTLSLMSM